MKRKSIFGYILGFLAGIIVSVIGFYCNIIINAILDITGANTTNLRIVLIVYFISGVLAIIASFFYFKKAKIGGILMAIATVGNVMFLITVLVSTKEINSGSLLLICPALALLFSSILGIFAKQKI